MLFLQTVSALRGGMLESDPSKGLVGSERRRYITALCVHVVKRMLRSTNHLEHLPGLDGVFCARRLRGGGRVAENNFVSFFPHFIRYSGGISEPLVGIVSEVWLQHAVYGMHHAVGANKVSRPDAASVNKQASSVEYGASTNTKAYQITAGIFQRHS